MGHRTSISDYEMDHAWTTGPEAEGVDIEADRVSTTRAKKIEPEKHAEPKKSTARTKAK